MPKTQKLSEIAAEKCADICMASRSLRVHRMAEEIRSVYAEQEARLSKALATLKRFGEQLQTRAEAAEKALRIEMDKRIEEHIQSNVGKYTPGNEERLAEFCRLVGLPVDSSYEEILKVVNSSSENKAKFLKLFIGETVTIVDRES